jgi:uncharacterized protein (TIGR03118 family)
MNTVRHKYRPNPVFSVKKLTAGLFMLGASTLVSAATVATLPSPYFYGNSDLVSNIAYFDVGTNINQQSSDSLINIWGITFDPNGPAWVANTGSGTAVSIDGGGNLPAPPVYVPGAYGTQGDPTGIVFNTSTDFKIAPNHPAKLIFANRSGTLAAWSPEVDLSNAKIVGDTIPDKTIAYTGLALAATGTEHFLYAADFYNAKVRVFDSNFKSVDTRNVQGCDFSDPSIPNGFAPYGIHNINGNLYVTYAKQDASKKHHTSGPGLGYVNIFRTNGCLVKRFASQGSLNAPWAVTLSPADFRPHDNEILVGNTGDGSIRTFNIKTGVYTGGLRRLFGELLELYPTLHGLAFGNGLQHQDTNALFYANGLNNEFNGVYGVIYASKP